MYLQLLSVVVAAGLLLLLLCWAAAAAAVCCCFCGENCTCLAAKLKKALKCERAAQRHAMCAEAAADSAGGRVGLCMMNGCSRSSRSRQGECGRGGNEGQQL